MKMKMKTKYYLGIDIGKRRHHATLQDGEGKLILSIGFDSNYEGFNKLIEKVGDLTENNFKEIRVGLEATGIYWLTLYEQLSKTGMEIIVLNPLQVKSYKNHDIRGSKTDSLDSELIVKILRFGEYSCSSLPDDKTLGLKQLTRLRSDLTHSIGELKSKIVGLMDQVFPEYQDLFNDMFSTSAKEILKESISPEEIAKLSTTKLTRILTKASKGHLGKKRAKEVKETAKQSIGITIGLNAFSLSIEILLAQVEHLEKQVKKLDKEIEKVIGKEEALITSIPGIGKVTSATILAEIGDFSRFVDSKNGAMKLVAFAGLDPKLKESGQYKGKAKMSKRGSPYLRRATHQAAFSAVHVAKDPMFVNIYQKHINKGKHSYVALSHVQRKMLRVVYSLIKNNRKYQPNYENQN